MRNTPASSLPLAPIFDTLEARALLAGDLQDIPSDSAFAPYQTVAVVEAPGDGLIAITERPDGRLGAFVRTRGGWAREDLGAALQGLSVIGAVHAWLTPLGAVRVAVGVTDPPVSGTGGAYEPGMEVAVLERGDTGWTLLSFLHTQAFFGNEDVERLSGDFEVLQRPDGKVVVAGHTALGEIVAYVEPETIGNEPPRNWTYVNITRRAGFAAGEAPIFGGDVEAFVMPWDGLNIAQASTVDGHVRVYWTPGGTDDWRLSDLTVDSGAPDFARLTGASDLESTRTPWGAIQLTGRTDAGHAVALWWAPGMERWRSADLTDITGADASRGIRHITSMVTPWRSINIVAVNNSGGVDVFWWLPASGWRFDTIRGTLNGEPVSFANLEAASGPNGRLSLVGTPDISVDDVRLQEGGDDGERGIFRLGWDLDGTRQWYLERITG